MLKEVNEYKKFITELEEKYFILQTRHSKRQKRYILHNNATANNNSFGLTQFGSTSDLSLSIAIIPDYIVKENIPKDVNPLSFKWINSMNVTMNYRLLPPIIFDKLQI